MSIIDFSYAQNDQTVTNMLTKVLDVNRLTP